MAAEGTISVSTVAALAVAALHKHTVSTAASAARSALISHFTAVEPSVSIVISRHTGG
jgi:hypothetical protein